MRPIARVAWLALGALLCSALADAKPKKRRHYDGRHDGGLYLDAKIGGGVGFVSSEAAISNGFRQRIESSARGPVGALVLDLGGTPSPGLVIGGQLGYDSIRGPVIETLDRRFQIEELTLELIEIGPFAYYFPDPGCGFYLGAAVPFTRLELRSSPGLFEEETDRAVSEAETLAGLGVALELGRTWWIGKRWSLGVAGRALYARMLGRGDPDATVITTGAFASVMFH